MRPARAWAGGVAVAVATAAATAFGAAPEVLSLDRVTPVPEGELIVRGALRTSIDGSVFDAVTQRDGYPGLAAAGQPAPARLGGLFDLEAGGLRLIARDEGTHVHRLAAIAAPEGWPRSACAAAGVGDPCLVPRLEALARERLVTAGELRATLEGRIEIESLAPPLVSRSEVRTGAGVAAGLLALGAAACGRLLARRRRATLIGQARAAARAARRAMGRNVTLAPVRDQIADLVARAEGLERARRACARDLARVDRRAREVRAPGAGGGAPPAPPLAAEAAEADRLAADLVASVTGLERITSALRLIPLRVRVYRGVDARGGSAADGAGAGGGDPVDALLAELDTRDVALREADAIAGRRPAITA